MRRIVRKHFNHYPEYMPEVATGIITAIMPKYSIKVKAPIIIRGRRTLGNFFRRQRMMQHSSKEVTVRYTLREEHDNDLTVSVEEGNSLYRDMEKLDITSVDGLQKHLAKD